MYIATTRFGEIEVDEEKVITFPKGLYGFERRRRFCLIDHSGDSPLKWMQSLEDPALAFVVVNPFEFFHDYIVDVSDEDAEALRMSDVEHGLVLAIVAIPENPWEMTANLLAPVVINVENNVARQVILVDTPYTTKHRLISAESASDKEAEDPNREVEVPCSS